MEDQEAQLLDRVYAAKVKELEKITDAITQNERQYDNILITLSTAFITASIAVVNSVVNLKEAISIELLISSWTFSSFSIISIIFSYIFASHVLKIKADWIVGENNCSEGSFKRWHSIASVVNLLGGGFFMISIIFFFIFLVQNII